jgi:hypothetical protein
MNYEQYIPQFLRKPPAPVAFPPLLPDRWGSYPSAQAIITGADRDFYTDPTINPNAKSREFRKAVAANWASDAIKYNPHYFTVFPYGLGRDNNPANSTFSQTAYLKSMQGDTWLDDNYLTTEAEDFERADDEINPPAHTNAHLIENLIVPYIAGEPLNPVNAVGFRKNYLKDKKSYEKDSMYYADKAMQKVGGKGLYAEMVDERIKQRQAMTSPRYTYEPIESLGWGKSSDIAPTDRQLEQIRTYRSLIDRAAGVDPDVPWQYDFE